MTRLICTSSTPEGRNDVQAFPAAYPLEVEYEILYHIRDQRMLLIACNAVCRAWRAEIRPYLFHTVRFRRSYGNGNSIRDEESIPFLELIQQSPDIPQYVRRLVLEGSTRYWVEILSQLRSLEDLTITSSIGGDQPILQSLQKDMVKFRGTLPSIKHLRLRNLRFDHRMSLTLPQLLLGFPRVSTLFLHYVNWPGPVEKRPPAYEILPELENLTIKNSGEHAAAWVLCERFDKRLRNISLVKFDAYDLIFYQDLLDRSGIMTPEHSAVFITTLGFASSDEDESSWERKGSSLFAFPGSAQLTQATFSLLNQLWCDNGGIKMEIWTKDIDTLHSLFDWEELARTITRLFCYWDDEFTFILIHKLSSGQRDLPPELLEAPLREYFSREPGVERLQFRLRASDTDT
ncbi:hypothetical protein WOLCODRAFT_167595 [Wolfiporia cocos MD-104 SS10]|uniref:F-box domain-containing protein n=1 Tax=Wolfiporia cocos (strain MD-104) TaxID=742152 RepID=A0A2H3J7E7_WOLCO|nr:hypothetical protein WOLCODRAFT_167595 [Wolfiporia cocos MD-104 SS10]